MTAGPAWLLAAAAFAAGIQNAVAGGGSFLTFPALLFTGLDPRAANITSTVALFPGQIATALSGKRNIVSLPQLGLPALFGVSLAGGALGALLLLSTPVTVFSALVPWLVLFATLVFIWGNFLRKNAASLKPLGVSATTATQFSISVYGGYFGGGIGILMLAALTMAGAKLRGAGALKNALGAIMNFSAVLIFIFSRDIAWKQVGIAAGAALVGGQIGAQVLNHVNEKLLKICVAAIGIALTIGLFLRHYNAN